jgi:hypothetical protein
LQVIWQEILEQKTAAKLSLIRRAAAARTPRGIAFTLLYEAKGNRNQDPENLRRQLKAVKLQPPW